jgi:hypothetical protein
MNLVKQKQDQLGPATGKGHTTAKPCRPGPKLAAAMGPEALTVLIGLPKGDRKTWHNFCRYRHKPAQLEWATSKDRRTLNIERAFAA